MKTMKFTFIFCLNLISVGPCLSQTRMKQFVSVVPNWNINNPVIIKKQAVSKDSVFLYTKRKNNHDSTLVMTEYFDSSGNTLERDEYGFDKTGVWRITNYNYEGDLLVKKEVMSKTIYSVNNLNLRKSMNTFEYDSKGNIITESEYSYFGDSLENFSVTIRNKEYDTTGRLTKEFLTLPKKEPFLNHIYFYNTNFLSEVKNYDYKQEWLYSYIHEYDKEFKIESIYLSNISPNKKLESEFFYDDNKRLIQEKDYTIGRNNLYHSTQTYLYNADGLLKYQSFQDVKDNNYYFKHFYSK